MLKKAKDKSKQQKIRSALDKLKNEAKRNSQKLDLITPSIKARQKKVVTKSFHKIGLVVPLDQNDVGYRPLNQSDGECILMDNLFHPSLFHQRSKYFCDFLAILNLKMSWLQKD